MTQKRLPQLIAHDAAVRLRLCEERDQAALRTWKNANRQFFFHKDEITEAQQAAWFAGYSKRLDDHMYIIEEEVDGTWVSVGVAGVRLLPEENTLDAYNIMRGSKTDQNRASMGECFRLLCDTARREYGIQVSCKVLVGNPALDWYKRLGFRCREATGEYELLVDDAARLGA